MSIINQEDIKAIKFKKSGYDPFIDFLKAYSILVVIFCHGFPYLKHIGYAIWGVEMPLFFMIQVFHCYKREPRPINYRMVWKRIIFPFVVIEMAIFGVLLASGEDKSLELQLKTCVMNGGYGPGSYYPWVYLQMTIIIPLMRPICENLGKLKSFFVFALISIVMEITCSLIHLPDSIYKLFCIRYFFLIWCGWNWVKDGIKFDAVNISASFISLIAIVYFAYFSYDLEPLFYNTGWTTHRWICYIWASFLFVGLLHKLFVWISKKEIITEGVKVLASASYEIFLVQMAYYALISYKSFSIVDNKFIQFGMWFIFAFIVSIIGGVSLYSIEKNTCFNDKENHHQ